MSKRKEIQTAIVEDLNGRIVRMPGYLLPLDVIGAKVTEFLLVPYIGACIHVPPPPPNQIVYVKVVKMPIWSRMISYSAANMRYLYIFLGFCIRSGKWGKQMNLIGCVSQYIQTHNTPYPL
jgi:hypothetical protein